MAANRRPPCWDIGARRVVVVVGIVAVVVGNNADIVVADVVIAVATTAVAVIVVATTTGLTPAFANGSASLAFSVGECDTLTVVFTYRTTVGR